MAKSKEKEICCHNRNHHNSGGSAVYCLGLIGAAVYYIQQATSFGEGVIGLFKAFVWPAYLLHKALTLLGM